MHLKILVSLASGFALVSRDLAWADTAATPSSGDTADSLTEIILSARHKLTRWLQGRPSGGSGGEP